MVENGLRAWLWQRVTAVIIATYSVFLLNFVYAQTELNYLIWRELFTNLWVKLATFAALASVVLHAWIGVWTISTDYLKPVFLRLSFQILVQLSLVVMLVWGIHILWSV